MHSAERIGQRVNQASPEVVAKRQIMFESKAQTDGKAQHTSEYVSIMKRLATQLSDIRWGFETTAMRYAISSDLRR